MIIRVSGTSATITCPRQPPARLLLLNQPSSAGPRGVLAPMLGASPDAYPCRIIRRAVPGNAAARLAFCTLLAYVCG